MKVRIYFIVTVLCLASPALLCAQRRFIPPTPKPRHVGIVPVRTLPANPPISALSPTGTNRQPAASSGNMAMPSRAMITNAALQRIALASHPFFPRNGLPLMMVPLTVPMLVSQPTASVPPVIMMAVPPYGNYSRAGGNASLSTVASPQGNNAYGNAQPQEQAHYESQPQTSAPEQAEAKPQGPVDRLLASMDVDHDSRISPREARGLLLEMFTRLDGNNDGYLDRYELEAALQRYPGLEVK